MSKRKNGFTLVELLAVIVILAVILVIAVPQIMNTIKEAKYGAIKSSVKLIADGGEKEYINRLMLGKDTRGITCDDVSKLGSDYKDCTITLDPNGKATVTIVGQNKFEGITCTGNKNEVTCGEIDNSIKNYPTMVASYGWYKGQMNQSNVETIEFLDSYTPTGSELESWNVDVDDTGSIKAYIVAPGYVLNDLLASGVVDNTDENEVKVIIAGNGSGGIFANEDSSCMFGNWCSKGIVQNFHKYTNLRNLTKIEGLSILDTSKVTDMSSMFQAGDTSNFNNLTSLDLSNFDTSKVTDMRGMFYHSAATTLDLSSFDTSNVTNMRGMFDSSAATSLDLSSFDTSKVTDMAFMFDSSAATTLDLSSFDTSNVTDMSFMFDSSAATTGYARTQEDADRLNASYGKPDTLTFVTCFSYQNIISSFDINEEACKRYTADWEYGDEELTTYCKGGEVNGTTMKDDINNGWESASELKAEGVISNVKYADGISITGYNFSCPKDVIIPSKIANNSVTTIGYSAFEYHHLTSVTIPNSVTTIGSRAFKFNDLTSVTIPNSVISIGEAAFNNNKLNEADAFIYKRNSDGTIDNTYLVSYGGALKDVTIPNSVTTIGIRAFSNNQLTSVTIPNSVTSIGDYAFSINQLTSVTIPNSVTYIGECAFNTNKLNEADAFIYKRNSDGTIDNTYLVSYGGALKDVTIPNSVTSIGDSAFYFNNLTSVTIPNSVTTIGRRAFSDNNLTSVTIPNSVTTIGSSAFKFNDLTSVTIPNSVTSIGSSAFEFNDLISVTIPNSVTSIGSRAFSDNNLTSVTIPNNVTSIGRRAFYKSRSSNPSLTSIVNTTGRSFDWSYIITGNSGTAAVTGTYDGVSVTK